MAKPHNGEDWGGNAPSLSWQEDIDQTFRIYHLAREIYPKRWDATSKGDSWDRWFFKKSGMTLDDFIEWANENKLKERWNQSVKKSSYKTRLRKKLKSLRLSRKTRSKGSGA